MSNGSCEILEQVAETISGEDGITQLFNALRSLLEKANAHDDTAQYYFRGEAKSHPDVRPSIYGSPSLIEKEDFLFKECFRLCPFEFQNEYTTFEKLVKMQHYSLPTRLLDITSNPLIALFFASQERLDDNKNPTDGRIVVLRVPNERIKFSDSDTVCAVSNICKRPINDLPISNCIRKPRESNAAFTKRFNKECTGYLIHEIKAEKPYFIPCIKKEDLESVWCVKPLMKNVRIIKQDGLFLLFGIDGCKTKFSPILQWSGDYSEDKITQSKKFDIPATQKQAIRQQLSYLGVSNDKIYPDLENIAKYLKKSV